MRLLVINPNTTASMTWKIAQAARLVARPDTEIVAANPANGPYSIEGFYDAALCLPGLLEEAARHRNVDAVVIACFDDTGLDAMRCLLNVPVIGIGEAGYTDPRPDPPAGAGYYYMVRLRGECGPGTYGQSSSGEDRLPLNGCP